MSDEIEAALERIRQAIADAAVAERQSITVSYHDLCVALALAERQRYGEGEAVPPMTEMEE